MGKAWAGLDGGHEVGGLPGRRPWRRQRDGEDVDTGRRGVVGVAGVEEASAGGL